MAQHFRLVRMDLRGHGDPELPPMEEPLLMERLAQDVRELMAEIVCEATHCAGSSADNSKGRAR